MPHVKEHPLAGRRVVTNSDLALGTTVYVIGWAEHLPSLMRPQMRGSISSDAVMVRDVLGPMLVPDEDLPTYDPVPAGYVS